MLGESKKYQLRDLIEKIEKVDEMVKLHSSNPSSFMLEQYEAKKQKLLGYFISELLSSKIHIQRAQSFRLISLALKKFSHEEINDKTINARNFDDELKDIEALLV